MDLSAEGEKLLEICNSAAEAVSESIKKMVGDPTSGTVMHMGADGTPTKNIDGRAEEAVIGVLERSEVSFAILSEEMGRRVIGKNPQYFLHLDPLDGTFNAIAGIPFYSLSIYISGPSIGFGYVFDLAHAVKFYAERGRGAWTEGGGAKSRLTVSTTPTLRNFSVSAYTLRPNTGRIVGLGDVIRRIRTLGSTSLELCLVAAGRLDAFVDLRGGLRLVDVAAGSLIVEEAKGMVTDGRGEPISFNGDMWHKVEFLASNGVFHREILDLIGGGRG
ncbi:MAG: Inositol-1-monophosphatase family protein [Methanothrix harundinacea]|uniref:fructose-bisphosphatase n=1 Tax=Methanothrix harundinacea TaxID=301375 RepID=A0A101FS38_9EURY|nr:MAG: Inositol-1-monophosphatase family protein [Methanothrix harundinacea]KUK94237.1 MAG: Inositol-1-monophosphatase family protein [Methanothrix harundinacea]